MELLRRRLCSHGFAAEIFRYASRRERLEVAAERLAARLSTTTGQLHLVGHSLGGLLIRQLLLRYPDLPPGRIVTLGTPHQGSGSARWLGARRWGRRLLGEAHTPLCGEPPPWRENRPLGSIAGDLPVGIALFLPGLARPHDGTVTVAETRLEGVTDHRVVHASHLGLLFSRAAAAQTAHFLRHGRFLP